MRRVLLQMGLSVDGIVAGGPQGTSEAGATHEDEAVRRWKVQSLQEVGALVQRPARASASQARRLESICRRHGDLRLRTRPASVTFETSGIEGKLEMVEDDAEPMFEELCVDWVASKMADDVLTSEAGEQTTQRSRGKR